MHQIDKIKKTTRVLFLGSLFLCGFTLLGCEKSYELPVDKGPQGYNGITIGTFGGSVSSQPASSFAREIWADSLTADNITFRIESNGIGGAGFSSNTGAENICNQIANSETYDVYILWASTNDVFFAELGDVNSTDIATQNGGINRAINIIKEKNKKALILFLTSLQRFDGSYSKTHLYSLDQIKVCELHKIPYLYQYGLNLFTLKNHPEYYTDAAHFNEKGYKLVAPFQASFIRKHISQWRYENKR